MAFDTDRLIGVANYTKTNDPDTDEVALAVGHDQDLPGVGTALLRHLAQIAGHNGIRRFVADILAEPPDAQSSIRRPGLAAQPQGLRAWTATVKRRLRVFPSEISFRRFRF